MTLQDLTAIIDNNIKDNNQESITGGVLNYTLKQMLAYLDGKKGLTILEGQLLDFNFPIVVEDLILAIAFKPTAPTALIKIGTSANGDEITSYEQLPANKWTVIHVDYLSSQNMQIFISGITSSTDVRIYKN